MGVYSNSRFFNESTVTEPEADMSYYGTRGANRIIAEMVQNDMAFFEGVIVNDIQEAYLMRAVNEGKTEYEPQLMALQEAANGGIFKKIKEFLNNIWKKIKGLIETFIRKISSSLTVDNEKLVKKYADVVNKKKNNNAYKNMDFKFCDPNNTEFHATLLTEKGDKIAADENKLIEATKSAITVERGWNDIFRTLELETKRFKDMMEDSNFEHNIYAVYMKDDAPADSSELANAVHKFFFKDEETKRGEFNKYEDLIKKELLNSKKAVENIKKHKTSIDTWFNKTISTYEELGKKFDKDKPTGKVIERDRRLLHSDEDITDKYDLTSNDQDSNGDYKPSKAAIISKAAGTLQQYYSKLQTCIIGLINAYMREVQFEIKQCRRVWLQAVNFNPKHESTWIEAIGEAADAETDLLFAE